MTDEEYENSLVVEARNRTNNDFIVRTRVHTATSHKEIKAALKAAAKRSGKQLGKKTIFMIRRDDYTWTQI
jgi:hypothetical protein